MWGSSDVESPWITSRDLAGIPVEAQDVEYSYETWSTVGGEEAPGSSMRLVSHCLMVISKKPWQLWKKVIGLLLAAKGFRWRCPGRSAIVRTTMQFNILKKKLNKYCGIVLNPTLVAISPISTGQPEKTQRGSTTGYPGENRRRIPFLTCWPLEIWHRISASSSQMLGRGGPPGPKKGLNWSYAFCIEGLD